MIRLAVRDLVCRRGGRRVLRGLSFALSPGEALVVTGRNGAGKSTLLGALAGTVRPDSGTIALEGADGRERTELLHHVGHRDGLKASLGVRENLRFAADLLGSPRRAPEEALAAFGLGEAGELPVAHLSAGQRRRVALARLLVAHRPVWLLDEPTTALDSEAVRALLALLERHLGEGGLVVAATHAALPLPGAREVRLGEDAAS